MTASESMDVTGSTATAEQAGSAARRRPSPETVADVVLTVLLLALFGWAFLQAAEWSFRTALFPRIVSGTAFVLSALHLLQVLLRLRRGAVAAPAPTDAPDAVAGEGTAEDDAEYIFQTAGGRRWASALGWVAAFFVLLYVGGLFVTAPLFSFFYLRFAGRRTWVFSTIYAGVSGVVLYAAFELALGVPTPAGLFLN
jgi:hypothetical protein